MGSGFADRLGRYELLIELGRGGMAELFLGRLHGAGGFAKLVAIKRILPHLARDAQFTEMFLNESRIAARLSHPNVCQVFELDDHDGELYLVMEYLEGAPWSELVDRLTADQRLSVTMGVLAQAASGLHYAHTLCDVEGKPTPVVHRDVSPHNLFVTIDGVCKVLDFGVSKMMTDGPRTRTGVVKGKLPYMAPEQIRGESLDGRADVFSLAVCGWEALAGERLFDRTTDFQIWKAITEDDAPLLSTRWRDCPPAVEVVIARALHRDPAHRTASAQQFARELIAAVPDSAQPAAIAEVLRASCGPQIAARATTVAQVVSTRRSTPPQPNGDASAASAAITLDLARSAAATLDDLPPRADRHTAVERDRSVAVVRPAKRRSARASIAIGLAIGLAIAVGLAAVIARSVRAREGIPAQADATVATHSSFDAPATDAHGGAPAVDAAPAIDAATPRDAQPLSKPPINRPPISKPPISKPAIKPPPPPPPAIGHFSITSQPYATIYVDGRRLGETPLYREPLSAGAHQVRAVLADGRERTFAITVPPAGELNSGKLTWP